MLPASSKSMREPGVQGTPPGGALALAMVAVTICWTHSDSASSVTSNTRILAVSRATIVAATCSAPSSVTSV